MIFGGYNRIRRRFKERGARKASDIKGVKRHLNVQLENIELPGELNSINHYSAEGEDKEKQRYLSESEKIPEPIEELSESDEDSKYGLSVFDIEETEIGGDLKEAVADFYPEEDYQVTEMLREKSCANRYMTIDELLEEMGMHRVNLEDELQKPEALKI